MKRETLAYKDTVIASLSAQLRQAEHREEEALKELEDKKRQLSWALQHISSLIHIMDNAAKEGNFPRRPS